MIQQLLIGLVKGYRLTLSPWLGSACRFTPTCSAYSLQALERHGAAAGAYLTAARIARCHPWCEGGHDPVPETKPRLFTRARPDANHSGSGSNRSRSGSSSLSGSSRSSSGSSRPRSGSSRPRSG